MIKEERRKFPRSSCNAEVEYVILDQIRSTSFTTGSRNIGSGGICIIVFEKLNEGDVLGLRFSIPGLDSFIIAKGLVIWTKEFGVGDKKTDAAYNVGIKFLNLNDKDRDIIQDYVSLKIKQSNL